MAGQCCAAINDSSGSLAASGLAARGRREEQDVSTGARSTATGTPGANHPVVPTYWGRGRGVNRLVDRQHDSGFPHCPLRLTRVRSRGPGNAQQRFGGAVTASVETAKNTHGHFRGSRQAPPSGCTPPNRSILEVQTDRVLLSGRQAAEDMSHSES